MKNDDWNSWSLYIIKTIETLQVRVDNLEEEVYSINLELQKEITKLKIYSKVASIIYGAISAVLISVVSGFITYMLTTHMEKPKVNQEQTKIEQSQKK